ncbi:hypothetical protein F5890DRAFT_1249020 [Lentinula detonsa]|uniref:Uncharacterized protein n=1 Tax=Lentinula detonsa TaxID=2804962 RepID=A0AA38Q8T7_9AGAR|nr:hypothetical protein F5890DRAFT_1249020 [Lentinula detonsa]
MRYFQLGGYRTIGPRWDNVFRVHNGQNSYNDQKVTAKKVFDGLNVSVSSSKVAKDEVKPEARPHYDPGGEEEEIILTLGILPSGASVLLLTPTQIDQLCSHWHFRFPSLHEAQHSSTFESLSPIEFDDIDSLANKLRSLAPKPKSTRDTSRDNKGFCHSPDAKEGSKRGLFENARLLRQLAMGRISPPPPLPASSPSTIHDPYAQFSVPQNFYEAILPKIHVAAFAHTLWAADKRPTQDRHRSPDLLDVAWARAQHDIRDLRASVDDDTCGQQVNFGWNAFKAQPGMIRKAFPSSTVQAQKDPNFGSWILQKLLQPCLSSASTVRPDSMPDGESASSALNAVHLILLVYDEPATRAIFLADGVDLLSGVSSPGSNPSGTSGDGNGTYRWKWINDLDAGLKLLLRDDSYGNLEHTVDTYRDAPRTNHRPSDNLYKYNSGSNRYTDRRSPSSSTSSIYASRSSTPYSSSATVASSFSLDPRRHSYRGHVHDPDSKSDNRNRNRSPPRASERYGDRDDRNQSGHGKRGLEIKQEYWDHDRRPLKRPKSEPRDDRLQRDENGDDTTSEAEYMVKSEPNGAESFVKKEESGFRIKAEFQENAASSTTDRGNTLSSASTDEPNEQPSQPSHLQPQPEIQIHVLDLKTLFHSSTGSQIGAESVQAMARELQLDSGGVLLSGMLLEKEFSSGWDAALMLSIFQTFIDGRTVDEQRATAASRRDIAKEEEIILQKQREAERIQNQSIQPGLDDDVDPNDFRGQSEEEQNTNWLGDEWSDYGESD